MLLIGPFNGCAGCYRTPENTDLSLSQVRAFGGDFGCQCRRQSELLRQNPGRRPGRYPSFITAWGPMLVTIRAFEAPRYESEGGRCYCCIASRMVCSKREGSSDAMLRRAEVVIFNQNSTQPARMTGGARSLQRLFDVYIVPHASQMPSTGQSTLNGRLMGSLHTKTGRWRRRPREIGTFS